MGNSQNGWQLDPALRAYNVPGTQINLQLVSQNDVGTILTRVAGAVNSNVAALKSDQCGGYDKRPIGALGGTTSNHRSGTAIDLNWSDWPQHVAAMTGGQVATCRQIVAACGGVVRWGGDYGSSDLDQMHWEINTIDRGAIQRLANQLSTTPNAIVGSTPTTQSANTGGVTEEPLPVIGPAAQHAVIPLSRVSYMEGAGNRFGAIRVAGLPVSAELSAAVASASMSFSSSQIGQFSMTIIDTPDASILSSGLLAKGTTIDWGDQHLDLRSLDYRDAAGSPQITVKARSRVVSTLKGPEHSGRGSWGEQDVTAWVLDRCAEAGAIPVVQGNLGSLTFTRQEYDSAETTWDVMQRAAKTVGCLCYEFEQIITFMRPTALVDRMRCRAWDLTWNGHTDYTNGLAGMPAYTWSLDGQAESLTFDLVSEDAELARPGDGVELAGNVGEARGGWMVTDVAIPLSGTKPVGVTCARPIDPPPQAVTNS